MTKEELARIIFAALAHDEHFVNGYNAPIEHLDGVTIDDRFDLFAVAERVMAELTVRGLAIGEPDGR